jgi:uncharacterized SAM-binding protein YcdF (DUF218 family)
MPLAVSLRVAVVLAPALLSAAPFAREYPRACVASLASALQDRFSAPTLAPFSQVSGIVALGGGIDRTREAIKLARMYPRAKLVVTGASEEDYALARAAIGKRLVVEPNARNTYENALFTKQVVEPTASQLWVLVTSASHMPRAVGAFRNVGFAVEPWPVRDLPPSNRERFGILRHEWLGLLAYRLMGRSDSLYPGPSGDPPNAGQDGPIDIVGLFGAAVPDI